MALKGDLGSIDLAHVFQMLTMSQKTGTLEIHTGSGRRRLYFDARGILFEYDEETFPECVAQQLQVRPGIANELMDLARTHVEHRGIDLLSALLEMQTVSQEQVEMAFRERMEEEIYDLFLTGDISFEFYENERIEEAGRRFDEGLVLSPNTLIMEAARRLDEWNFIQSRLPSDSCIFEVAAELKEMRDFESDCPFEEVYAAIDGFRTITSIIEVTGQPRYQVCRALARMSEQRIVYQVHPDLLVTRARRLLTDGQTEQGVALLERALDQGHEDADAFLLAAEANESLDNFRRASGFLTRLADWQEEEGQRDEATLTRMRVREMLPTDVFVREQILRFFFDEPSFFENVAMDPLDESEQLAWMLQCIGREAEARDILVSLHLRFQDDWKTTQRVSRIAVEMGAPKTAVQILLDSAEQAFSDQNWQQALRLYHRIRTIDPSHPGLDSRIQECQKGCDTTAPKIKPLMRRAIVALICAGAGGGYLHYNHQALKEFRALETEDTAVRGEFRYALRELEEFRASFPGTVTSLVALNQMESLEDRERAFQARQRTENEFLKVESERQQTRAERRYQEAEVHIRAGQYPEALAALRESNELATSDKWRQNEGLAGKIQEIADYLGGSQRMHETWSSAMDSSDWETAHRTAIELRAKYPLAPHAKEVILPVVLQTEPPGASVRWQTAEGEHDPSWKATTPVVLKLQPDTEYQVVFELEGYQATSVKVQPTRQLHHSVRLPALPVTIVNLQRKPLFEPAATDELVVVCCENGRIALIELDSRQIRWERSLPDLQENASNPVIHGSSVSVAGTNNELIEFSLETGKVVRTVPLPAKPTGLLSTHEGRLVLALEGPELDQYRVMSVKAEDGSELWTQTVPAPITVMPAFGPDRVVIGLENGTIVHLTHEQGVELDRWELGSAVMALSVGRDWIYAGCEDGTLAEYRVGESEPRWSRALTDGRAVRCLVPRKAQLLVTMGEDLLLVQRDTGTVRVQRKGWATGPVLAEPGTLYVVPQERTVLKLDEEDLTIDRLFQADQPLQFAATGKEFPVLIGSQGGVYRLEED